MARLSSQSDGERANMRYQAKNEPKARRALTAVTRSWTGDWTGVRPWGDGHCAVAFRKVCLLVGDGTVDRLPCCCPGEDSRRVCSRWLREIDICELQGCWSAAPALCADAVRQVDFAQLWSRREVEARPSLAWAEPVASPCLAHVLWTWLCGF